MVLGVGAELLDLGPDLMVSNTNPVTTILQSEVRNIPLVFVSVSDPVGSGFVTELARPTANVTGFANFRTLNGGKWLEKLKEIALNPEGAVAALTRAIAIDRVGDGSNAIAPGTIDTPYFDEILKKSADLGATRKALAARQLLGRLGTPEEIAAGILFLASDESRFATDTILTLDGGMTAQ